MFNQTKMTATRKISNHQKFVFNENEVVNLFTLREDWWGGGTHPPILEFSCGLLCSLLPLHLVLDKVMLFT